MSGGKQNTSEPTSADLETLIREFQASDATDLHVRTDAFELILSKDQAGGQTEIRTGRSSQRASEGARPAHARPESMRPRDAALAPAAAASAAPAPPTEAPNGWIAVRAPYKGTFYRAPKPGEKAFVEIGAKVPPGTDLCLVEVMKLFTAVRTERGGVVREIYAVDGQMVEESQILFAIEPEG